MLQQAYADVRDGEIWLVGAHISVYDQGNIANHEPDRDRKLLLHKREVASLSGKVFCFDANSDNVIWECETGSAIYDSSCAYADGHSWRSRCGSVRAADRDVLRLSLSIGAARS